MQAHKIRTELQIFGMAIALIVLVAMPANVSAAEPTDVFTGISFEGTMTDADIAFLHDNLQLFRDQLPAWAQYIEQAKPLVLAIDLNEGAHGRAAIAKCCDSQGRGIITFGFHLGQSPDDADKTLEGKQVAFIGTFVHEVTHIRDQRAGRGSKTNFKSCVTVEKSGLEKQLEVKRALALTDLDEDFLQALDEQINAEATALKSRTLWDHYCGWFN